MTTPKTLKAQGSNDSVSSFVKKPNERLQALTILTAVVKDKVSLSQAMPTSTPIAPLTKELCFGLCRHYFRLDTIANHLVKKKPKETEIWIVILMGLYQLHYMRKPDYAVVKETVALLEKIKKVWVKGLVNAVLRHFCRQQEEIIAALAHDERYIYGQPEYLLTHLKKDWPQDWQRIALAHDMHPPMTLRVNQKYCSVTEYLHLLKEAGMEAEAHSAAPEGVTLHSPCEVHKLPYFSQGWVSVQDGAAQQATSLLALEPGLRVLDACCAPGGKTCHILECEPNLKECVAVDVSAKRLERVNDNLARLGLQATVLEGDALVPELWWDGQLFDRILLDAPCSATGVIRRHPDIKLLRNEEDIHTITQIQQAMLHSLWPLLRSGGIMVYATCSLIAEENDRHIEHFVASHSDCTLIPIQRSWGKHSEYGVHILPGEQKMDGFFYSVLLKDSHGQ